MSTSIKGGGSSNLAAVDANGNLQVTTPVAAEDAGWIKIGSENDAGTISGTAYVLSPETTDDYQLRIGHDTLFDHETFCYAAQNTAKHTYSNTTITNAWSGGYLVTNSGLATTTTTGTLFQTRRYFPIIGSAALYFEFNAALTQTAVGANTVIDFGAFLAGGSTPYAPTDGAYFRWNNAGLFGVINNGSETTTSAFTFTPVANQNYKFTITVTESETEFWIDDVLYATIPTPVSVGQPFASASLPLAIRHAHTGVAGVALSFKVSDYTVSIGGVNTTRTWDETMSGMGQHASQGASGGTMGSTALYTNSLAAGAGAAATNTTAALGSGLGGQFAVQPTLTAGTDGIISSYQNPAGTTALPGRNLVIYGVKIDGLVTTAFTGGPVYYAWSLAYGHTAVSLATAEAATTKAARRIPLGIQTYVVTAAVGTLGQTVQVTFINPIVVQPGEFVQTVAKNLGTVTSAGVIVNLISFDAKWE
jgi:hypothetical protein